MDSKITSGKSGLIGKVLIAIAMIVGLYFLIAGLVKAQGFFAPLTTALILSLTILPICQKLESFMNRTVSSLIGTFLLMFLSLGLFLLIVFQLKSFKNDWPEIKETMQPKIEQLGNYIEQNTPLDKEDLKQYQENNSGQGVMGISIQNLGGRLSSIMMSMFSFLGVYLLMFIYIYFILRYRLMFKNFLVRITPDNKEEKTKSIISKSAKVAIQYLQGKLILIGILAVFYSIGLGLAGVSNFPLVAMIAATLTLVPYVGNIVGFAMAMVFGYLTTGTTTTLVGITATFVIAQLLENYILEPFIVGDKVDVHPFFVIVGVIAGNYVWGVIGMVLAIPLLGILTVTLLHIDKLKPLGLLFSKKKIEL